MTPVSKPSAHDRAPATIVESIFLTLWETDMNEFKSVLTVLTVLTNSSLIADDRGELTKFLRDLDPRVATASSTNADDLRSILSADIRQRRRAVNSDDVAAWRALRSKDDWETFQRDRIAALRESLGEFPDPPADLDVRVTKTLSGDGFEIDCLVFESRPGLLVTANLYRPDEPRPSMPGIMICHSHHNPKTQNELQDMGMNWARSGGLVLVMDQLGHGERRQHPFRTADDYAGDFQVGRQDYYFRYNVGIQLHLIGDSLIGWMVWDLMRGVDLLLDQPGIDSEQIILLGAVAGGGDPCAVAAALDERIAAAVPLNFGGPQPENVFPLPEDSALSFNYIGSGSWESTRNLRVSAGDGFLPWVIVGSVAPRRLIYAHEFSWDRENDPVWRRLQQIYNWYEVEENLSSLFGYGQVKMSSDVASHCNNIGEYHRKQIYPAFQKWFGIDAPDAEYRDRREWSDLYCVEGVDGADDIRLPRAHELANDVAINRTSRFRDRLRKLESPYDREFVRNSWRRVLGYVSPGRAMSDEERIESDGPVRVIRTTVQANGFSIPLMLLVPNQSAQRGSACVVAVAQGGKAGFLEHRSAEIAELLENGIAVCLPDLPGCGETSAGNYRARRSSATGISSSRLMFGGTIVGDRLRDLLSVVSWVRARDEINGDRIAIWGDSFAAVNSPDRNLIVPLGIGDEPDHSEPIGPMLSLLAGLYDDRIEAVLSRNGLVSMRSLLDSQFVHVPHDFVIPGALTAGDVADLALSLGGVPVRVEGLVDGTNRRADAETVSRDWGLLNKRDHAVELSREPTKDYAGWLVETIGQSK